MATRRWTRTHYALKDAEKLLDQVEQLEAIMERDRTEFTHAMVAMGAS